MGYGGRTLTAPPQILSKLLDKYFFRFFCGFLWIIPFVFLKKHYNKVNAVGEG
jgi:hypothetical protein